MTLRARAKFLAVSLSFRADVMRPHSFTNECGSDCGKTSPSPSFLRMFDEFSDDERRENSAHLYPMPGSTKGRPLRSDRTGDSPSLSIRQRVAVVVLRALPCRAQVTAIHGIGQEGMAGEGGIAPPRFSLAARIMLSATR